MVASGIIRREKRGERKVGLTLVSNGLFNPFLGEHDEGFYEEKSGDPHRLAAIFGWGKRRKTSSL